MLGKLLVWCDEKSIPVRMGEVYNASGTGHKANSNHYIKLAADLLVYRPGASEQDMDAHEQMHDFWDSLGGAPRIKDDMNHYSVEYQGKW